MADAVDIASLNVNITVGGVEKTKRQIDEAKNAIKRVGNEAKKNTSKLGKFAESLKRIALYRTTRWVLKEIAQGFREGVSAMYQWSLMSGTSFARSMDTMSTSLQNVKNSLAVAVAPIIENVIVPAVEKLSSILMSAGNAIARFLAILAGQKTYTIAVTGATKQYAKAVNEAKKSVLGFDELNVLNGISGGGDTYDYGGAFKEVDVGDMTKIETVLQLLFKDIRTVFGNGFGGKLFNSIVDNLPMIAGMTIFGGVVGGKKGAIIGLLAGLAISFLKDLDILFGSEIADKIYLGIIDKIPVVTGMTVLGAVIGGGKGAIIGMIAGLSLSFLKDVAISFKGNPTVEQIVTSVLAFMPLIAGLFVLKYGNVGTAILTLTIGALICFAFAKDFKAYMNGTITANQFAQKLVKDVLAGIAAASAAQTALKFAAVGNIPGALITLTIGAMLFISITGVSIGKDYDGKGISGNIVDTSAIRSALNLTGNSSVKLNVKPRANGGYLNSGDMFLANENGSNEFIGRIGNRSAVANNDQIVEAVSLGVYNAVSSALNGRNNNMSVKVYLDGREIKASQQRLARATG